MPPLTPPLTPPQLSAYLARLRLPATPSPTLQKIVTNHIRYIPFESLSLHYSRNPTIALALPQLLEKIVGPAGRGGYCMEINTALCALLETLGFDVWTIGAKVSRAVDSRGGDCGGGFLGWSHMALIVNTEAGSYAVDAGFGGSGLITPIPLVEGVVVRGIGLQMHRLVRKALSEHRNRGVRYWILQVCEDETAGEWLDLYAFSTEVEFTAEDYEVMNCATSTKGIFASLLCCARTILRDELTEEERRGVGEGEAVGRVLLGGNVIKRRVWDRVEVVGELKSERERVEALRKWFGVVLTEEQRVGIRGRASEIKGGSDIV